MVREDGTPSASPSPRSSPPESTLVVSGLSAGKASGNGSGSRSFEVEVPLNLGTATSASGGGAAELSAAAMSSGGMNLLDDTERWKQVAEEVAKIQVHRPAPVRLAPKFIYNLPQHICDSHSCVVCYVMDLF